MAQARPGFPDNEEEDGVSPDATTLAVDSGTRLTDGFEPPSKSSMRTLFIPGRGRSAPPSSSSAQMLDSDRYEFESSLGQGGMGEVRLVRDRRIGRSVALKCLRESLQDASTLQSRFVRESTIQGQLEHPNIVPVYDLGVDAEGRPFFTMKRLNGRTLFDILLESPPSADSSSPWTRHRLLSAFASVCQAVEYAHSRGVLHRDLKPSNIMLGEFGEVYVLDWGIAKITESTTDFEDRASQAPLVTPSNPATALGSTMGTFGYLAPEQYRSDLGPHTQASDVYSLGAILYEIVTGQAIYPDDSDAYYQWEANLRPLPTVPETCDAPPELLALWDDATRYDPSHRIRTVRELALRLEHYLAGDRDKEKRKELGALHCKAALAAADAMAQPGHEALQARKVALQEVGRALALDADNEAARALFLRLLTVPIDKLPPEVQAERDVLEDIRMRKELRSTCIISGVVLFCFLPALVPFGIIDWVYFGWMGLTWLNHGLVCAALYFAKGPLRWRLLLPILSGQLAAAFLLPVGAHLSFVPTILTNIMGISGVYHVRRYPKIRTTAVLIGLVGICLPAALETIGILPPVFLWSPELKAFVSFPHVVRAVPELTTPVSLLVSTSVFAIILLHGTAFKAEAIRADDEQLFREWQLRQMTTSPRKNGTEAPITSLDSAVTLSTRKPSKAKS
jgi:serine/threonine-protein kinase